MKKYLLICLLIFLSISKFRNLKNLTLAGTTSPQIKFLSQNQLAYQSQSTITTFNIQTGKTTQTINLQTADIPAQLLPSQSVIIYVNKSSIYEARTLDNNKDYRISKTKSNWISPISSFGKTTVAVFYSTSTSAISLSIFGPKTSDFITKDFMGQPINGIRGGSSASFLGDDEFYFVAGGQCNVAAKYTNLYQNSRDQSKIIYKFTFDKCHFSGQNQLWNLQSKKFDKVAYHLLTLKPTDQQPFSYTSQLISNSTGKFSSAAHFETQRLIGVQMSSSNTIYTADNMLCRVLQHDIDNHQHEHYPSAFNSKPLNVQIYEDLNILLATVKLPNDQFYSAVFYSIDKDNKLAPIQIYATDSNYVKAELYQGNYIIIYGDSKARQLTIYKWKPTSPIASKISSIFDISVSSNFIYVAYNDGTVNILEAFQIVEDKFNSLGSINIDTSVNSIKALEGDSIILIPKSQGENIQIFTFQRLTGFTIGSSLKKNDKIHSSFTLAGQVLLFTSKSGDTTTFYDYKLKPLTLSFNLPANTAHSIIDYRNGQVLLAIGDDISHFVSLEYYKITQTTVTYLGTFPYLDEGKVDASKTFLFPTKRALHVEFQSAIAQQWSTYFDLDNPPLKSFGYFYDQDSYCSDYSKAIFSINSDSKQILLLYNSVDANRLETWAIEGPTLVKKQSVSLNKFKSTNLDIKIASQGSIVLVNGISSLDDARNYAVQVRNMKSLSQILSYQIISDSSNSQSFESADIVNNMFVSSYSSPNLAMIDFGISFKSITQSPLPVNNQLFTSITIIATCQSCNWIAFTGQLTTPLPNSQIIIQDYTNPSSYQQISANCKINLLAISPAGNSLSWNCQNNALFVYDISKKTTANIDAKVVYQKASDLLMISQTRIIVSLDGVIRNIDLTAKSPKINSVQPNAFSSVYATNLQKQIYAVAIDASTIQLISFSGQVIDTVKINNSITVSSMSFNINGDLYISNGQGFIVALTEAACPKDQQLQDSACVCKPLFNPDQGPVACICPYTYDSQGGNCNCNDGQYFDEEDMCLDCSFLCTTCYDGEGFDCDQYSGWFYVFIILLVLIVAGAALFIALKLKKKKRLPSLMTEEKQATEPFVSEREREESEQGTKEKK